MNEVMIKTHLIIKDTHEEYIMKWCGSIVNTQPQMKYGKPVFIIRSKEGGAVEVVTTDVSRLEKIAKKMTFPRGREALTSDVAYIYIKQIDNSEKILGVLTHNHIKQYAPMYDKVYCE